MPKCCLAYSELHWVMIEKVMDCRDKSRGASLNDSMINLGSSNEVDLLEDPFLLSKSLRYFTGGI